MITTVEQGDWWKGNVPFLLCAFLFDLNLFLTKGIHYPLIKKELNTVLEKIGYMIWTWTLMGEKNDR